MEPSLGRTEGVNQAQGRWGDGRDRAECVPVVTDAARRRYQRRIGEMVLFYVPDAVPGLIQTRSLRLRSNFVR